MRLASFTLAIVLIPCLAAAGRPGRIEPPGYGSAIALEYSIEPATLAPDQDVELHACLTNQNLHAGRDVQPGDAFTFAFGAVTVVGCGAVSVFALDGAFTESDFTCEAVAPEVTLRFDGGHPVAWAPGSVACAEISYHSASGLSSVAASMTVGNRGAFAPAAPAFILLAIGAAAPGGGGGGAGEVRIGQVASLSSTDVVSFLMGDPPKPVPGLDTTITVQAGSRLEVSADLLGYGCLPIGFGLHPRARIGGILELDGGEIASRGWVNREPGDSDILDNEFDNRPLPMAWLSQPLAAGPHHVRVIAFNPRTGESDGMCMGVGPGAGDPWDQSRVIIHELLAPN
jgi:hypothetical protein